jgi:hypothetical protein
MKSFILWTLDKILTNSVEQSLTSEGNRYSASQEIPLSLLNPIVPYRIYKHPPTLPTVGQSNSAHVSQSHFLKINFSIILPSTPSLPNDLFP